MDAKLIVVAIIATAAIWFSTNIFYFTFASPEAYMAIETFTAIMAAAVSYISIRAFFDGGSPRMALMSAAFAAMAVTGVMRGLTFGSTAGIWVTARVAEGALLFASAVLPVKAIAQNWRKGAAVASFLCAIIIALIPAAIILSNSISLFFVAGAGLTLLKTVLEYAAMVLYAATALIYLKAFVKNPGRILYWFAIGAIFLAFNEIALALYVTPWDAIVWIGHGLKVAAFAAFGFGIRAAYGSRGRRHD
jgi:hypothetical protein